MIKQKIALLFSVLLLAGCASGYNVINPSTLNYKSTSSDKTVTLDYKYNLLSGKYQRKETRKNIRLVAVKITNNSASDLVVGKDLKLTYGNGKEVQIVDNDRVYSELKQQPGYYLFYLLLTPFKFTTTSNGIQTNSIPLGYAIGPGIAGGNIIAASSANGNFKNDLMKYQIMGTTVKSGSSAYGLVGISSDSFDNITIKVESGAVQAAK
jgi:hypothetical protein